MKIKTLFTKHRKLIIVSLILLTFSISATYTYFSHQKKSPVNNPRVLSAQTENYQPKTNKEITDINYQNPDTLNILLLGYGGAGHSGGFLTDVIQLLQFDFINNKITFISIPRDLWVTMPNGVNNKINKAFTMGNKDNLARSGSQVTASIVEQVTGLKVDNFISVDFVSFKRIIGYELEGITVNVPETLDDPWYPVRGREQETCGKTPKEVAELTKQYSGFELEKQFQCRYDHIHFDKGLNYMEGGDALAYVRSRHGSKAGDFSRSQRQQALLIAIKEKLFKLETLKNVPRFFKQASKHIDTDFTIETIEQLTPLLTKTKNFKILNITLSTSNVFTSSKSSTGQYIIIPKSGINNWQDTKKYIQNQLRK